MTIVEVAATAAPLEVEGLSIRYPGRREPALDGVSLSVIGGERVGIAGRTGAGKSTLALAAAGFIPRVVRAKLDGRVTIDVMVPLQLHHATRQLRSRIQLLAWNVRPADPSVLAIAAQQ